jgi:galactokinase
MTPSLDLSFFHNAFRDAFGTAPRIFRSPGRINLIGEHTDYNEGFVLPAAIDRHVYVGISPRNDGRLRIASVDFSGIHEGVVNDEEKSPLGWPDYALGVLSGFRERGINVTGFDMLVGSDLPVGAGLSSSAAYSCAVGFALNQVFDAGLERVEMIRIAQLAEHRYAGVMCGIMDPFASMTGRSGHLLRLDCRSLEYHHVPFLASGVSMLLLNTNVKHSLASSAYNRRREECATGLEWVRAAHPEVKSLRDVSEAMLDECVAPRDSNIDDRCRYVVQENERLLALCDDMEKGDLEAAGRRMFQTHDGLSNMYDVSCPELDYLVDAVRGMEVVYGARMMGGGFGGCTINLVRTDAIPGIVQDLAGRYEADQGRPLTAIAVNTGDGTSEVTG